MRKIFVISLSLLIVILSFAFCFASGGPVILPVGDGTSEVGYPVMLDNGTVNYYSSNNSPTYLVNFYNTTTNRMERVMFSEIPYTTVYAYNNGSTSSNSLGLQYNGYYYTSTTRAVPDESYGDFASVTDVMDNIFSSVFSTTFDLTYLVDGSVSWLSTFAQAVKTTPLLLFFVVFIFVGIGIGLLNRFRRG